MAVNLLYQKVYNAWHTGDQVTWTKMFVLRTPLHKEWNHTNTSQGCTIEFLTTLDNTAWREILQWYSTSQGGMSLTSMLLILCRKWGSFSPSRVHKNVGSCIPWTAWSTISNPESCQQVQIASVDWIRTLLLGKKSCGAIPPHSSAALLNGNETF